MQSTRTARFRLPAIKAVRQFDLAWMLTCIVLSIDIVWLLLAGRSVPWPNVAGTTLAVAAFLAPLSIGRYRRDLRLRITVRAAALLFIFQAAGATLSYLVISTNAPLIDAPLAVWDRALGFDWLALHGWLQSHPSVQTALRLAYQSGLPQLAFVILFLGLSARPAQLDQFMRLFIAATLLTIIVSGLLPAAGAWKHYALADQFDLSSLSHFEQLRDGRLHDIPLGRMQGLISIPSLHAAMAVLLVHAMRETRLLSVFVVLNAAMLASTPIDGGHYLVDVLAGTALAIGLIAFDRQRSAHPRAVANIVSNDGLEAMHQ